MQSSRSVSRCEAVAFKRGPQAARPDRVNHRKVLHGNVNSRVLVELSLCPHQGEPRCNGAAGTCLASKKNCDSV